MTEEEWDRCVDVRRLLTAFGADWQCPDGENRLIVRKFRLFFCALMRERAWPILQDRWQRLVGIVEKLADKQHEPSLVPPEGILTEDEFVDMLILNHALNSVPEANGIADHRMSHPLQASLLRKALRGCMLESLWPPDQHLFIEVVRTVEGYCNPSSLEEGAEVGIDSVSTVDVIRCVLGNPFRSPPAPDSHWLTWNGGVIPKMAELVYEEGRFQDMPVLADCLEDAGCESAHVLEHCRCSRGHWKGCSVLDLLRPPFDRSPDAAEIAEQG